MICLGLAEPLHAGRGCSLRPPRQGCCAALRIPARRRQNTAPPLTGPRPSGRRSRVRKRFSRDLFSRADQVGPFSSIKWSHFRLSIYGPDAPGGPPFEYQMGPFSIDKNNGAGTISVPPYLLFIATLNNIDKSTYPIDYGLLSRFRTIEFSVNIRQTYDFLIKAGLAEEDALTLIQDLNTISQLTGFPIGQAHFRTIGTRRQVWDWYSTVLRPSLRLFLTRQQESMIASQIDPQMRKYRE